MSENGDGSRRTVRAHYVNGILVAGATLLATYITFSKELELCNARAKAIDETNSQLQGRLRIVAAAAAAQEEDCLVKLNSAKGTNSQLQDRLRTITSTAAVEHKLYLATITADKNLADSADPSIPNVAYGVDSAPEETCEDRAQAAVEATHMTSVDDRNRSHETFAVSNGYKILISCKPAFSVGFVVAGPDGQTAIKKRNSLQEAFRRARR